MLSAFENDLYRRQLSLPGFDTTTQIKLKASRVLIVGAGGLGAPAAIYLAAAGVGTIGIMDNDTIAASNLHRQILFSYRSVGSKKVQVTKDRICALNPFIDVRTYDELADRKSLSGLLTQYDVVIDATDNFETKYILDSACAERNVPLVYGSVFQFEGQVAVFHYGDHDERNSYRDLFQAPPPSALAQSCNDAGVIGVVPGIIGCIQAGEALKIVTGLGKVAAGRLLTYDMLSNQFSSLRLGRKSKSLGAADDSNASGNSPCNSVVDIISISQLLGWISEKNDFQLLDIRKHKERTESSLGGTHIPLSELPVRLNEISRDIPVLLYCQSGARSANAQIYLKEQQGFSNCFSIEGGLNKIVEHDAITAYFRKNY